MTLTLAGDARVTAVQFYKGPLNTGPHTADLWDSFYDHLATATFTDESQSGWQEADFSQPVYVTGGETYIASYFGTSGYLADDEGYFANQPSGNGLAMPSGWAIQLSPRPIHHPIRRTRKQPKASGRLGVSDSKCGRALSGRVATPDINASDDTPEGGVNFSVAHGKSLTITGADLLANDVDPNTAPTLSIQSFANPSGRTLTDNGDGTLTRVLPHSAAVVGLVLNDGWSNPDRCSYPASSGREVIASRSSSRCSRVACRRATRRLSVISDRWASSRSRSEDWPAS